MIVFPHDLIAALSIHWNIESSSSEEIHTYVLISIPIKNQAVRQYFVGKLLLYSSRTGV